MKRRAYAHHPFDVGLIEFEQSAFVDGPELAGHGPIKLGLTLDGRSIFPTPNPNDPGSAAEKGRMLIRVLLRPPPAADASTC